MTTSPAAPTPVSHTRPGAMTRRLRRTLLLALSACTLLPVLPADAITNGQPDGGRHPYVGGTVLYFPPRDETIVNCTGSLISRTIFLTAAHCGRDGTRRSVSFDEAFEPDTSVRHHGTFVAHPDYDPAQESQNDLAVIVLDNPVEGVDPARLPTLPEAGLLDRMKDDRTLDQSSQFTSVGYGFLGFSTGPGGQTPVRGQARHYSVGSFNSLSRSQLHLSQNLSHDNGGTCSGDSGGPTFLGGGAGETSVVVSLTSTGDTYCRATNVTYVSALNPPAASSAGT